MARNSTSSLFRELRNNELGEEFDKFVVSKLSIAEVRAFALAQGMVSIQQDALLRVIVGVTTIAEVVRVTGPLALPHEADVPLAPLDVHEEIVVREKEMRNHGK